MCEDVCLMCKAHQISYLAVTLGYAVRSVSAVLLLPLTVYALYATLDAAKHALKPLRPALYAKCGSSSHTYNPLNPPPRESSPLSQKKIPLQNIAPRSLASHVYTSFKKNGV